MLEESINKFLTGIKDGLIEDAKSKNQRIPVSKFRIEVDNEGGRLFAATYLKYLVEGNGRAPGKFPPPPAMLAYVESLPDLDASIKKQSLAYLFGRKLALEGSDIYQGKKPGIDFKGVVDAQTETFLKEATEEVTISVLNLIKREIQ